MSINNSEQLLRRCASKNAISFVLETESIFNYAGYKVIRSTDELQFVKPGRLLHNGKVKLIYNISEYRSLASLLEDMDSEIYANIICNIYDAIKRLGSNGFIKIENTIINNEEIFIDIKDNSVHLICLPLNECVIHMNSEELHRNLKSNIMDTIKRYKHLESYVIKKLIENLSKDKLITIDFTEKSENECENKMAVVEEEVSEINDKPEKKKASFFGKIFNKNKKSLSNEEIKEVTNIKLESLDSDTPIILNINKDTYTIGKNESFVDGLILNDKTISRIHCRIVKEKGQYYITDLGSLNGTYVNNKKLIENNFVAINKGDVIKISRINFIVK